VDDLNLNMEKTNAKMKKFVQMSSKLVLFIILGVEILVFAALVYFNFF
jgi:hypothetical protein